MHTGFWRRPNYAFELTAGVLHPQCCTAPGRQQLNAALDLSNLVLSSFGN